MYTEEKPRRGGLLKEFVMRLILIIIFVLLLLWIIPWSKMDVNPLKDQIFNANIQTMKEAGITYFTTERLPKEVGDKVTLTLQKMLDLKLVLPFTDRNGNSCDVKKSYITLEKQETEYLMKVNLKCGEEEDYILVHLGCYSYCTTAICEAKKGTTEKTSIKPTATATPKVTSTPRPTPTATPKPTPTSTPKPTPTATPTPTPTATPEVSRLYEYKKTTKTTVAPYCEKWSNWKEYYRKANDGVVYGETATKKVEPVGKREIVVGKITAVYVTVQEVRQQLSYVGNREYKVCTGYNYFADQQKVYKVESDWSYATGTDAYYYGTTQPADSIQGNQQIHYELVGIDFDKCENDCTNHPYLIYRKQVRTVTAYTDLSNLTAVCTNTETRSVPIYTYRTLSSTKQVLKTPEQEVKKYVAVYRVSVCENYNEGSSSTSSVTKWSTYNDTKLLNDGFKYTGNYQDVTKVVTY